MLTPAHSYSQIVMKQVQIPWLTLSSTGCPRHHKPVCHFSANCARVTKIHDFFSQIFHWHPGLLGLTSCFSVSFFLLQYSLRLWSQMIDKSNLPLSSCVFQSIVPISILLDYSWFWHNEFYLQSLKNQLILHSLILSQMNLW